MVIAIVLPIIIQNAITNFVSLLDNLMVGRIGTDEMSGVAITNQLMFVFNLTIFGAVSGAGIFSAQYHGAGNVEGVRHAFRYKLYIALILCVGAIALFLSIGPKLISLYLTDTSDPVRVANTLKHGMDYLKVMVIGLIPFALSQSYAGTLRETGETFVPMLSGIIAVLVNLLFNWLLIFGVPFLGIEPMGVRGAAYATVLSRYVELAIIVIYTHTHTKKHPFGKGLYRSLRIPGRVIRDITIKGLPLLANELIWSMGIALLSQIYSARGLDVVAATNISSTVSNLFSVAFLSMGSASSIIVGQTLGANEVEKAKDHAWKMLAFSTAVAFVMSLILAAVSPFIPMLYNTTASVRGMATRLILATCAAMAFHAYTNCSYFILRSGGKTVITFIFDSGFVWLLSVPLAFVLTRFTGLNVVVAYLCVQMLDLVKAVFGYILIRTGIWVQNIVAR
ncbi:MAG: MATE family efflux transporter [Clostridia bacterium]|nr:MATE family efflux transporter [Clostridia bacterium]